MPILAVLEEKDLWSTNRVLHSTIEKMTGKLWSVRSSDKQNRCTQ